MWATLRTFSPTRYSSLPGWMMPPWTLDDGYPLAAHVVDYLARYEERYELQVRRPVHVDAVTRADDCLVVHAADESWRAEHVVSATGTWTRPFVPRYPGSFRGRQLHASQYRQASDYAGQRALIVGGGNSAAQILAEVSAVAATTWVTLRPPRFLPDDVDGRALFELATARQRARSDGDVAGAGGLGDIVMVDSVREARDRGVLRAREMFTRLDGSGVRFQDGSRLEIDTIIWCTGFRPALGHLSPLGLRGADGLIATDGETQALKEPRLQLIGYGDWTGAASATLIGAGRNARTLVRSLTD